MNREELIKQAYAEGAFIALQQLGYEKTAAAEIAVKMAEEEDDNGGIGALGGAGLGALGGAGLGAGGAALASLLMKKNLMSHVPGLGRAMKNKSAINARLHAGGGLKGMRAKGVGNILKFLSENPTGASAIGGGIGGAGLGALGGGLYGGLSD